MRHTGMRGRDRTLGMALTLLVLSVALLASAWGW